MIEQENRMDLATTVHHPPENEVDFELLWGCISKIWRTTHMATYTKEIEKLNNKIVYINSIVEILMFILVSLPLGLVTGSLSGFHEARFDIYKLVKNFGLYNVN